MGSNFFIYFMSRDMGFGNQIGIFWRELWVSRQGTMRWPFCRFMPSLGLHHFKIQKAS